MIQKSYDSGIVPKSFNLMNQQTTIDSQRVFTNP